MRFDALSSGPYRRFWLGSIASVGSTQLYFVGMAWLVFELSDSALDLGLLGAATAVPTILATLVGGLVADRINRRSVSDFDDCYFRCSAYYHWRYWMQLNSVRVWHVTLNFSPFGISTGF